MVPARERLRLPRHSGGGGAAEAAGAAAKASDDVVVVLPEMRSDGEQVQHL